MIMGWMADEYASIVGQPTPAVITGKPLGLGGSLGRDDATARGGYYLVRHMADQLGLQAGARVAIQGFGNAGQNIARLLGSAGYSNVAVSDSGGGVQCHSGLESRRADRSKGTGISDKPRRSDGVAVIAGEELVSVECDLPVPAALEDMIHRDNAAGVKARVVLELANGPTTPEADEILSSKRIVVLPDILANAGGVTVSYFEWVQNRQGYYWLIEDVDSRLRATMEREGDAVWTIAQERKILLRSAAYVHALSRLAGAIEAHGTQQFFAS